MSIYSNTHPRVHDVQFEAAVPMSRNRVVLAYSGGLDTSVAIRWLQERDYDVVALALDVGQPGGLGGIKEKAERLPPPGGGGGARPLIGKYLVAVARREGARFIAHGCTGKGNDQVRFDLCTTALAPDLQVIAPARVWGMTRDQEIEYARERGIPVPVSKASPYSTDENLWGRSVEAGVLEDPLLEPPEEAFAWTTSPLEAPEEPAYANLTFEEGVPVALGGRRMDLLAIIESLNSVAGAHGVGRIDHIESRVVGIKSREVYECPAATVLIRAHQALEAMVLPRDVLDFKRTVEARYAPLIYDGLWFTPLRESLDAFVESTQTRVTGEVSVKLFKGSASVVGRTSPYSLYNVALATYGAGDKFRQDMAEGFIYVWGLPARTWAAIGEKMSPKLVKAAKRAK